MFFAIVAFKAFSERDLFCCLFPGFLLLLLLFVFRFLFHLPNNLGLDKFYSDYLGRVYKKMNNQTFHLKRTLHTFVEIVVGVVGWAGLIVNVCVRVCVNKKLVLRLKSHRLTD